MRPQHMELLKMMESKILDLVDIQAYKKAVTDHFDRVSMDEAIEKLTRRQAARAAYAKLYNEKYEPDNAEDKLALKLQKERAERQKISVELKKKRAERKKLKTQSVASKLKSSASGVVPGMLNLIERNPKVFDQLQSMSNCLSQLALAEQVVSSQASRDAVEQAIRQLGQTTRTTHAAGPEKDHTETRKAFFRLVSVVLDGSNKPKLKQKFDALAASVDDTNEAKLLQAAELILTGRKSNEAAKTLA